MKVHEIFISFSCTVDVWSSLMFSHNRTVHGVLCIYGVVSSQLKSARCFFVSTCTLASHAHAKVKKQQKIII